MCGIAGLVGEFRAGLMERMNAAQSHRGPDGRGVFEDSEAEIALGHTRLAILDLSDAGAQPMTSPDGRFVLTYNGEIYNYRELQKTLEARGASFRSTGDTEVLLAGWRQEGERFVERLNGMFAFAVWDRRERVLTLARDPLGIKPLYFTQLANGALLFASEIKALCAHPGLKREPDLAVLQQHLTFCHACGPRTALRGVRRLEPGTLLRWRADTRTLDEHRYWQLDFETVGGKSRDDAVMELRGQLEKAVVDQLVSDVPVGVFLSGGLDSTLVTALAARARGRDLEGYTITYPSEDNRLDGFDEDAPHARSAAEALGIRLREIEIRPRVAELWPRLVYHLDEPIADPAAIACYLISRLARDSGTPVLLSGQGADELFAGYPRYRALQATQRFDALPLALRRGLAAAGRRLPGALEHRMGALLRRGRRVLSEVDLSFEDRFLAYSAPTPVAEVSRLWSPAARDEIAGESPWDACRQTMQARGLSGLHRFLDRDLRIYLPNHNLLYTDKMGMAVGLEARVPLIDRDLVTSAAGYPEDWKLKPQAWGLATAGGTKAILRDAARGLVPDATIARGKAGFGAPLRKWLRYDLAEMWHDLTSREAVERRGWFDPSKLQEARERSQRGEADLLHAAMVGADHRALGASIPRRQSCGRRAGGLTVGLYLQATGSALQRFAVSRGRRVAGEAMVASRSVEPTVLGGTAGRSA